MRNDGRRADQLRTVAADPAFLAQPHGMVLWSQGATRVLCTASVVESVPRWLHRSGRGWVTAEYSLLPASTGERTEREAARGRQGGRTVEIQVSRLDIQVVFILALVNIREPKREVVVAFDISGGGPHHASECVLLPADAYTAVDKRLPPLFELGNNRTLIGPRVDSQEHELLIC